jgi:transposase
VTHALILTAVYSRHMFVFLSFGQDLTAVIGGFEAAWAFFGGVFRVVIVDNMAPVVDRAHPLEPRLNRAFAEYAQDRGFGDLGSRVVCAIMAGTGGGVGSSSAPAWPASWTCSSG